MNIDLTNPERLELLKYVNNEVNKAMHKNVTVARFEKLYELQRKLQVKSDNVKNVSIL